jgi:hypothetical protein
MTVLAPDDVVAVAESVAATGESVFADLETLRVAAVRALDDEPTRRGLAPLRPLCERLLTAPDGLLVGAGFVAAPDVLQDVPYWLEWWTVPGVGEARGTPEPLEVVVDPTAEDFRDYTALPWFAVPRGTGERHVTGPYVDYLCTDEYTLTFTVPVEAGGRFAGVVGADVYVRHVELRTLAQIDALPGSVTLVNAQGRVLVSNDGSTDSGSLVRDVPVPRMWGDGAQVVRYGKATLYRCGNLPFGLLVTP